MLPEPKSKECLLAFTVNRGWGPEQRTYHVVWNTCQTERGFMRWHMVGLCRQPNWAGVLDLLRIMGAENVEMIEE